jgi:hypothetical protein
MWRANSAGVLPLGMAPLASSFSFTAGLARALAVSCWMRLTISGGVPAGASRPNHELASKPLRLPACYTVGTPGSASLGCAMVTARAFSLPALISCIDEGRLSNITSMSPPTRLSSAGPEPPNGKCVM